MSFNIFPRHCVFHRLCSQMLHTVKKDFLPTVVSKLIQQLISLFLVQTMTVQLNTKQTKRCCIVVYAHTKYRCYIIISPRFEFSELINIDSLAITF